MVRGTETRLQVTQPYVFAVRRLNPAPRPPYVNVQGSGAGVGGAEHFYVLAVLVGVLGLVAVQQQDGIVLC